MDIYKRYKQLEEENYKLEQNIYHLEQECAKSPGALDRVESKMVEQFGEEEGMMPDLYCENDCTKHKVEVN